MTYPHAHLLQPTEPFEHAAQRLQAELGFAWPWVDGQPGVHNAPLVLRSAFLQRLYGTAERVGRLYDELARILWDAPDLFDAFYAPTPGQRLLWLTSGGHWHGFARLDVFACRDGALRVCEINADTPTGQVEATAFPPLHLGAHPGLIDPSRHYERRFIHLLRRLTQATTGLPAPRAAAILYPTDIPEDLSLIGLYRVWLRRHGIHPVLGSPWNLARSPDGALTVLGEPVDAVIRHYKTDWWIERTPLHLDEPPLPDIEPLHQPLHHILSAEEERRVAVINPFGSTIPQNKLSLAFFWEHYERFSAESRATIDAHIPETRRVASIPAERLIAEQRRWVLKSDYGCEGEEVLVGAYVTAERWAAAVHSVIPEAWVAQRFFDILPLDDASLPNYGVYLIAGVASGLFVRLDYPGVSTTERTRAVPALVEP